MSKLVQALLSGMLFTFFLDFFLFLGIKLNYIDFYEIDVYYNILFADNQNIYIYMILSVFFGTLIMYVSNKISVIIITIISILISLSLIPSFGLALGEVLLKEENVKLENSKHIFIGDIYYNGRKKITFYDYELKKIINIKKENLKKIQWNINRILFIKEYYMFELYFYVMAIYVKLLIFH